PAVEDPGTGRRPAVEESDRNPEGPEQGQRQTGRLGSCTQRVLVQLNGVSKSFGSQEVLRDVSFQINPSEKIGLIGANGAGKTTLPKIIRRDGEADSGSVTRRSGLQVGQLDQIPDFHEKTSVLEEGLRAFDFLRAIEKEMSELEHAISEGSNKAAL